MIEKFWLRSDVATFINISVIISVGIWTNEGKLQQSTEVDRATTVDIELPSCMKKGFFQFRARWQYCGLLGRTETAN